MCKLSLVTLFLVSFLSACASETVHECALVENIQFYPNDIASVPPQIRNEILDGSYDLVTSKLKTLGWYTRETGKKSPLFCEKRSIFTNSIRIETPPISDDEISGILEIYFQDAQVRVVETRSLRKKKSISE